jgi:hypothetical protein
MAMIAKQSVISQSSRSIDKIFWKAIIDDEKKVKGKPYFCEKASLKSVRGAHHNMCSKMRSEMTKMKPPRQRRQRDKRGSMPSHVSCVHERRGWRSQ